MSLRVRLHLSLLAAILCTGCSSSTGDPGSGVLVIAIDALRADHLSANGYDRDTTPGLDRLMSESVYFERAFAAAPQMIQTHLAVLTGCDPNVARRPLLPDGTTLGRLSSWYAPDAVPRLARSFLAANYATAAFVDHPWLSSVNGFDKGFERYKSFVPDQVHSPLDYGLEGMARPLLRWLGRLDPDRDWFAYITVNELERVWEPQRVDAYYDTYFEPREELAWLPPVGLGDKVFHAVPRARWPRGSHTLGEYEAEYDGALRSLDQRLAAFLERLRTLGRWETTTIVVIGSFGVGFGESGLLVDTGMLGDVDLHVPVIVKPASSVTFEPGRRIPGVFSLTDVAPTLLGLEGFETPSGMHGRSHADVIRGEGGSVREFALASCAIVEGFAVMDERYRLERVLPGSTGINPLTASWYGDSVRHEGEARVQLYDRDTSRTAGPESAERAKRMLAVGEDWFEWLDRAQRHLHPVPWEEEPLSTEEVTELRRRGLIPADDAWARLAGEVPE